MHSQLYPCVLWFGSLLLYHHKIHRHRAFSHRNTQLKPRPVFDTSAHTDETVQEIIQENCVFWQARAVALIYTHEPKSVQISVVSTLAFVANA